MTVSLGESSAVFLSLSLSLCIYTIYMYTYPNLEEPFHKIIRCNDAVLVVLRLKHLKEPGRAHADQFGRRHMGL